MNHWPTHVFVPRKFQRFGGACSRLFVYFDIVDRFQK